MAITFENVFDVEATKKGGRLHTLRRAGYVRGLTSTTPTSYVAEISAASAIPRSSIIVDGTLLIYKSESIKISDGESGLGEARVDITYERHSTNFGTNQSGYNTTINIRTSLKQIETARDRNGDPITVSYTFPADDEAEWEGGGPNHGKVRGGKTFTVGGKIRVLIPMTSLSGSFRFQIANPGTVTREYAGRVNSKSWQGGDPRTWMCTEANAKLVDDSTSPPTWEFSFSFEYDDQTWDNDTTAVFIDPLTSEPPSDVTSGDGLNQLTYYPEKDFSEAFG